MHRHTWKHVLERLRSFERPQTLDFKLKHSFPKLAVLNEVNMIVFGAHVLYSVQVQLGHVFAV